MGLERERGDEREGGGDGEIDRRCSFLCNNLLVPRAILLSTNTSYMERRRERDREREMERERGSKRK